MRSFSMTADQLDHVRDAVVWNTDARHKPELEVDIELLLTPDDIPGEHYARLRDELEVELCPSESMSRTIAIAG